MAKILQEKLTARLDLGPCLRKGGIEKARKEGGKREER